ncbi:hypothetical protein QZH41_000409 [Actinostola sp. cb2023]|nr:hypothetical protein QZH41_000409 [Actinostola sp. cb2023]
MAHMASSCYIEEGGPKNLRYKWYLFYKIIFVRPLNPTGEVINAPFQLFSGLDSIVLSRRSKRNSTARTSSAGSKYSRSSSSLSAKLKICAKKASLQAESASLQLRQEIEIEQLLIKAEDTRALQRYSVLLASCENTLTKIGYTSKIDNPDTLRKIIEKLPFSLRATADDINEVKRRDVTIHDVVDFVTKKARAVNHPIFGSIINDTRSDNSKATKPQHKSTAMFPRASTFATREEPEPHTVPTQHEDESSSAYVAKERNSGCYLCSKDHRLTRCELFKNKSYDERCKFVRWKGLCYNCLNPGHRSDACPKESFCRVTGCKFTRKHSTFLHQQEKPVRTETQTKQESTQLSKPSEEGERQPSKNANNSTNGLCSYIGAGRSITGLAIVPVKTETSTKDIPQQTDVDRWSHLAGIKLKSIDAQVDILIGNDVPKAHEPPEVRPSCSEGPYAVRTLLGWTINGPLGRAATITHSANRVYADVSLDEQFERYCKMEFNDTSSDVGKTMSQEDKRAIDIMEKFRKESVAMMSDIESMFYQVHVRPDDSKFLRYLWWPDGDLNRDPEEFQMLVHLFGGISSPSCASYALQRTADDNATKYDKETIYTIRNNFYVDDCLKSAETEDKALQLVDDHELRELLKKGGFNLTKWVSNSRKVIKANPETQRACSVTDLDLDHLPIERALGLQWDVERDVFKFKTTITSKPATRRGILSMTSSIYDPLGFISPYVLPAKFILQDLCRQGFGWDDPVPEKEQQRWNQWLEELLKLKELEVNRCLKPKSFGEVVSAELHNFSDASQLGYGVDCFGPFLARGRTGIKRYGIVFTCLAIRAIHIEVLHSMDTTSFVNSFRRFIARRGMPELDLNSHLESSRATICIHVEDGGKYNIWPTPSGGDGFENIFLNYKHDTRASLEISLGYLWNMRSLNFRSEIFRLKSVAARASRFSVLTKRNVGSGDEIWCKYTSRFICEYCE